MNIKRLAVLSILAIAVLTVSASATPFYVWQDTDGDGAKDALLGTVMGYTGGISSVANYNYYSVSAHPINGPSPEAHKSKMYMYEGSDGLSFGFFHNIDAGGNNYWNHVDWNIDLTNMTGSLGLSDDNGEAAVVTVGTGFAGNWAYILNTDGGVINDLTATDSYWEIIIDPSAFGDIQDWSMTSADGGDISLWTNPTGLPTGLNSGNHYQLATNAYTTYITPVPEPATMILFGIGLLGSGLAARRKRNKSN